jgi:ABC-2 type transport system permease protein
VGAHVRSQLQYRLSFAIDVAGTLAITFLDFVAVLILFHNVPRLGGWSVQEVAFLYGTSGIAFALADLLVGHLDEFPQHIRTGSFDLMLVRPRGTLFQVFASDIALRRIGKVVQAAAVLAWALASLGVDWSAGRGAMVGVMVVSGLAIYVSVWVFFICIVFWAVEGRETANAFTYGGSFLTQYPINVFGAWTRRFLAYVVPMAFVSYFPALYVLDKPDALGLPRVLEFLSPLVAVVAALVAGAMWRVAVRHYRSAGG